MDIRKIINISLMAVVLLVVAYLLLLYCGFYFGSFESESNNKFSDSYTSTITGDFYVAPIEQQIAEIDNTLPHYRYQKIKDSLEYIKQIRKMKNMLLVNGTGGNYLGFYTSDKFDSTYYLDDKIHSRSEEKKPGKEYYIAISGYRLKEDITYYRENGKNYLKYIAWDDKKQLHGHHANKEIPVALLPDGQDNPECPKTYTFSSQWGIKRTICIPVSESKFKNYKILLYIPFAIGIWMLYACFIVPVRIIQHISNGEAFMKKTIRGLYIVSFSLLGYYFLDIIFLCIIRWVVVNKVPPEFTLPVYDLFTENLWYAIVGVLVFVIARAFVKGYRLQQEQDLTV